MNTLIEYQYRDAQNYKKWNTVIVSEELCLNDLQPHLFESEFFVPSEVGMKDLQDMPFTSNDHIWHEIMKIEHTENSPDCEIKADKLVSAFKSAHSKDWSQGEVFIKKGLI